MRRFERRLRLATGLIIACFVVGHFLNHSLGVVSIDAMDRVRAVLSAWWRSAPGTVLLYGSLLPHFALALVSLYRRTTLRMPAWEAAQLVLGLAVPPLLIAHIVGTRFYWFVLGHHINYERMVGVLWSDTGTALRQSILLLIVWTHFCFGIHYWLRMRLGGTYQVQHASGRIITAPIGRSILEAVRDAGLPHASVCGGRARCTTCRVRISEGLAALAPPERLEAQALARIEAPPNVRLACQTRPRHDVSVIPLLPPGVDATTARRPGAARERERAVVAMFVDLRGSTRIAESRLPYDVVFIMNQFFAEMYEALRATNGYYAQFRGDGLLALYGLESDLAAACRDAMRGAAEMQRRVEILSRSLAADLATPLKIGIGAHAGVAIVGTMGPPEAPIYSAIGDNINLAARFEGMTKAYSCVMVVSADTLAHAGLDPRGAAVHRVKVRGRSERVTVYAVADPRRLFEE